MDLEYTLSTFDISGYQHVITDCIKPSFSNHYSHEGSGFGFLSFTLRRSYGVNYNDIGYGYEVLLTKGLKKILFHGIITEINEKTENTIEVSCVGDNTLLSFDILNFVVADNRVNRWTTACNPKGSYRPDRFDHSLSWTITINEGTPSEEDVTYDGIEIKPRRGIEFVVDDYYYIRYRFEFGEIAKSFTATYDLQLPNNWPGKAVILDGEENEIWSSDVSGNGSLDLDMDSIANTSFIEVRFVVTASGINTSEEGTVYFRLWDILVSSTDEATLDASAILTTIAQHMNTYFGFSDDYSLINTIGYDIPQAAFDADETLDKIANDACIYGDANANPVAWGTYYDDQKRMFLEVQDLSTIGYYINFPRETDISGNLVDSYQKVYGKYTDTTGRPQRTSEISAQPQIDALGGLFRKTVIELNKEIKADQMTQALTLALNESKEPKITTSFSISEFIESPEGAIIPVEEIMSGRLVQVPDIKAIESSIATDKRASFHTFMLMKVEVDLDSRTATLTPAGDRSSFDRYMELLGRLGRGE